MGREERVGSHDSSNKKRGGDMADPDRLTEEEGRALISVAREVIGKRLFKRDDQEKSVPPISPKFTEKRLGSKGRRV